MSDINWIEKIINAFLIYVEDYNNKREVFQSLRHANDYLLEFVKSQDKYKELMESLLEMYEQGKLAKSSYQIVLKHLFEFHKTNLDFANTINYLISK